MRTQRFVYYKPRIAYQRHKIVEKVVKSFQQDVQCVHVDVQSRVPVDNAIDHERQK